MSDQPKPVEADLNLSDPLASYSDESLANALDSYFNVNPQLPIIAEADAR